MKTQQRIILTFLLSLPFICLGATKEIPFTLDDRDRIIRTEQMVESLKTELNARFYAVDRQFQSVDKQFQSIDKQFQSIDKQFQAIDKRFDQLFNFLWAIIGIFTAMLVSVFGFAFWDRKLSLAPLEKQDDKILAVLKDYAKTQPRLSEILKNAGLL